MFLFDNKKKEADKKPEDLVALKKRLIENEVETYKSENGFSIKNLEYGLWYQEHKKDFLLAWIWFLVITATVFWSYCLYFFASYLLYGYKQAQENQLTLSEFSIPVVRSDYSSYLESSFVRALPLGNGRYDLVGQVTNNFANGWFGFNYSFTASDKILGASSGYVYPGQTKYIVAFDQEYGGSPYDLRFNVTGQKMNRLYSRDLEKMNATSWTDFENSHLNFDINDRLFQAASESGLSDKESVNRLSFSIVNNTAYDYISAPFLILLYNGQNLVATDRYIINDFRSKKKYLAALTFFGAYPPVNKIEIIPDFNILDKTNFGKIK